MTKSGDHCEGNENRKSQKPFIFANWTILSIFKKKFLDDPKFSKSGPKKNRFQIFFEPEKKTDASLHYFLPFLRVWKKSNVGNLL